MCFFNMKLMGRKETQFQNLLPNTLNVPSARRMLRLSLNVSILCIHCISKEILLNFNPVTLVSQTSWNGGYRECTSSVESQKGVITIQQCSVENQKGATTVQSLW